MFSKVAEIFDLKSEDTLRSAFRTMEEELVEALAPLEEALETPVGSMDPQVNYKHADFIGAQRNRVVKYLMLVVALVEHAKSDCFMLPKGPGVTETVREMHQRGLAGPYVAWKTRLEHLIEDIDNRINFCKKCLDDERKQKGAFRTEF